MRSLTEISIGSVFIGYPVRRTRCLMFLSERFLSDFFSPSSIQQRGLTAAGCNHQINNDKRLDVSPCNDRPIITPSPTHATAAQPRSQTAGLPYCSISCSQWFGWSSLHILDYPEDFFQPADAHYL